MGCHRIPGSHVRTPRLPAASHVGTPRLPAASHDIPSRTSSRDAAPHDISSRTSRDASGCRGTRMPSDPIRELAGHRVVLSESTRQLPREPSFPSQPMRSHGMLRDVPAASREIRVGVGG